MSKFYSPSTRGFYFKDFHKSIPGDAVEITDEEWQDLLNHQLKGKEIAMGIHGRPVAADHKPTPEGLKLMRDRLLSASDWLVSRHRDELEVGWMDGTTLTPDQYGKLQQWRHVLRNIDKSPGFPDVALPPCPV
jgi:hypothetical protein